jgi:hypothetical protein
MVNIDFEDGRRLGNLEKEIEIIAKELNGKKDLVDLPLFRKVTDFYGEYLQIAAKQNVEIYQIENMSYRYQNILKSFKVERPGDNLPF